MAYRNLTGEPCISVRRLIIRIGSLLVEQSAKGSGLGLMSAKGLTNNELLLTVPSGVALSVESPGEGPDHTACFDYVTDRRILRDSPWYVQFAVYLYGLDSIDPIRRNNQIDMTPWLNVLPRQFNTPIHWDTNAREELQYPQMVESLQRQEREWKKHFATIQRVATGGLENMSWDDFVWGCECARSRVFSGAFTGSAFNPAIYAFTLLLVTAYVGLGLGTIEQAANGAAVVLCASIFKDFVLPKLASTQRYVLCPVLDMANHQSLGHQGDVSFEFFGDAYSLAATTPVSQGSQLYISYGPRSNDQLLQYYGFVEPNNPHDVYIMPPLREWDIEALEQACGRKFAPGRLQKLDRAGLLGSTESNDDEEDDEDGFRVSNPRGGVVVTRTAGVDPAVIQALRALVSTDQEWQAAGEAVGNFATEVGPANEKLAKLAAQTALQLELDNKPTTLQQDKELLKRASKSTITSPEDELAILFRIEKKKLLLETIDSLA